MTMTDQAGTQSMVERVARAQYDQTYSQIPWEALSLGSRGVFLRQARTAIAEMREPTVAMTSAASSAIPVPDWEYRLYHGDGKEVWHAMIDAALSEEGE
jgi:hypothetical protein